MYLRAGRVQGFWVVCLAGFNGSGTLGRDEFWRLVSLEFRQREPQHITFYFLRIKQFVYTVHTPMSTAERSPLSLQPPLNDADLFSDYPCPPGTPITGIYARDGLWDELEGIDASSSSGLNWENRSSSPTVYWSAQTSRKTSLVPTIDNAGKSVGRRGTFFADNERGPTVRKKASNGERILGVDEPMKRVVKQKSFRMLSGIALGKRNELNVQVAEDVDDSVGP